MNIEELQAQMATAISKNDVKAMEDIAIQIVAGKRDRAKVEADKLLKESEALAGKREALAASIHDRIHELLKPDKQLAEVKAWGFTYKVDKANPAELDVSYKTVALTTAVVKAHKTGGGGNGKSKDEYGLSLQEIVDKFATPEELAAITAADSNSQSWQRKQAVKKRAIHEKLLPPIK